MRMRGEWPWKLGAKAVAEDSKDSKKIKDRKVMGYVALAGSRSRMQEVMEVSYEDGATSMRIAENQMGNDNIRVPLPLSLSGSYAFHPFKPVYTLH